jgi:O-methyltransferase
MAGASLMPKRSVKQNLIRLLRRPSIRATAWFHLWHCLFAYTPREAMLDMAMEFVQKSALDGDYLEFGVFEGDMFAFAFHMAKRYTRDEMNFYAFDSFCGLPPPSGVDTAGFEHFKGGQYPCNEQEFLENLRQYKVDLSHVTTVPGWFNEVLNENLRRSLPMRRAAIVWVDCDLYESAVPVLDFMTDYLQEGTVVIFDDWFAFRGNPARGEQRAWREWLAARPKFKPVEWHKFGWNGQSFIIQLSDGGSDCVAGKGVPQ